MASKRNKRPQTPATAQHGRSAREMLELVRTPALGLGFEEQRKMAIDGVTGRAKQLFTDLLVPPRTQSLRPPPDWRERLEKHTKDTRPGMATLYEVTHEHCITEITREQLARCSFEEQVFSIMRKETDADYTVAIGEVWQRMREWMTRAGVTIAGVYGDSDRSRITLNPTELILQTDFSYKTNIIALPERSIARTRREAMILFKYLANAFSVSFVQQWKKEAEGTDLYKRLAEFAPADEVKKTPEAHIRGGFTTAIAVTVNSIDLLHEFVQDSEGPDAIENEALMKPINEKHRTLIKQIAAFGGISLAGFESSVTASPQRDTPAASLADFLKRFGLLPTPQKGHANAGNSMSFYFLKTYFRLLRVLAEVPMSDLNLDAFSNAQVEKMMTAALVLTCPARGRVMADMVPWLFDLYRQAVLPMFRHDLKRKKS